MQTKNLHLFASIATIILLAVACNTSKNASPESSTLKNVEFKILRHTPYCGGAAPSLRQSQGYYSPYLDKTFELYRVSAEQEKYMMTLALDSSGGINLQLSPGKYHVKDQAKKLNFEDFKSKIYSAYGQHYLVGNDECIEAYRQAPDFSFEITVDTTFQLIGKGRCFTSDVPCLRYSGPYPP